MDYIFSRDSYIKHTSIQLPESTAFPVTISKAFILQTPRARTDNQQSVSTAQTTQDRQKTAWKEPLEESLGSINQFSPVLLISMRTNS